mmetsp:Transcript_6431/g.7207  ORF Transcript_6431/g.7207 Transcript_6431/m.7207 type:complete len:118 (-) Transcript_6431:491-844(-)
MSLLKTPLNTHIRKLYQLYFIVQKQLRNIPNISIFTQIVILCLIYQFLIGILLVAKSTYEETLRLISTSSESIHLLLYPKNTITDADFLLNTFPRSDEAFPGSNIIGISSRLHKYGK